MSTYKKSSKKNFTQVSNEMLSDKRLTLKARGLFAYMDSKPDDWNFTLRSMATQFKDGIDSISSAMKELKEFGYVEYEKFTDGSGVYKMYDNPSLENPNLKNAKFGKGKRISNTDLHNNKDKSNKEPERVSECTYSDTKKDFELFIKVI